MFSCVSSAFSVRKVAAHTRTVLCRVHSPGGDVVCRQLRAFLPPARRGLSPTAAVRRRSRRRTGAGTVWRCPPAARSSRRTPSGGGWRRHCARAGDGERREEVPTSCSSRAAGGRPTCASGGRVLSYDDMIETRSATHPSSCFLRIQ